MGKSPRIYLKRPWGVVGDDKKPEEHQRNGVSSAFEPRKRKKKNLRTALASRRGEQKGWRGETSTRAGNGEKKLRGGWPHHLQLRAKVKKAVKKKRA